MNIVYYIDGMGNAIYKHKFCELSANFKSFEVTHINAASVKTRKNYEQ